MAERPNLVLVAVGWLLTVLGVVWTLLAGGCTLVFLVSSIAPIWGRSGSGAESLQMLPLVLMFGSVGIVPGALILWGGIAIVRAQRKRD